MTTSQPSRKRWRIAVAVVVLFAAVGWLVAFPAYKRHRAIKEIERVGGFVGRETVGPQWLQKLGFGVERVVEVNLEGTKITDDGIKLLSSLKTLQRLYLNDMKRNDGVIWSMHGSSPTDLKEFTLSDDGLKPLGSLTRLKSLSLVGKYASDDALKHLSGLTNLQHLSLVGTHVSDDGLKHLSGLASLQRLYVYWYDTDISDEGLKHLSNLTNLQEFMLELRNTRVTDDGVKRLQLALPDCRIGYAGLEP